MTSPNSSVPRVTRALLALSLPNEERRFALADLEEEFEDRLQRDGRRSARGWYRVQAMRSIGPAVRFRLTKRSWRRAKRSRRSSSHAVGAFLGDLRYAFRSLRASPVAGTVTVLSLGVGIGAVTSAFALMSNLLFQSPVGLHEPERLVTVYTTENDGDQYGLTSYSDYQSVTEGASTLDDAAAFSVRTLALGDDGITTPLFAEETTGNYFRVTGITPVLGRGFLPEETRIGAAARVVVIGHDLWTRRFGADPSLLGQTIELNGYPFTVIGVAPDGIVSRRVPLEPDVWIPLGIPDDSWRAGADRFERRDSRTFVVMGRLRDGATIEQLRAQVPVVSDRLRQEYPDTWIDDRGEPLEFTVVSERASRVNPGARRLLSAIGAFFVGAAGLILLIACSNVAGLFLARAASRSREMAVRISLGASRKRLVAMLLTEGLVPGLASGLVGLFVAWSVSQAMRSLSLPFNLPIKINADLDHRVLLVALLLSVGASLVFSLVPALQASRPNTIPALKGEGAATFGRRRRLGLRDLVVIVQCTASVVLVVGASLFIRALQSATAVDLGFNPERVAIASKSLDPARYSPEAGTQYYRDLRERLSALPGVEDVQLARGAELTMMQLGILVDVVVPGVEEAPEAESSYYRNAVTPGYLEMLEVPMLRGRTIAARDREGAPLVAVVNDAFARRFWPGQDAIGKSFLAAEVGPGLAAEHRRFEVVGVARDGTYLDFDDGPTLYFWTSLYQDYAPRVAVLLKGVADAESMIPLLRAGVELEQGELQHIPPSTYAQQLSFQFIHLRIATKVLGWGGAFGLFLATIGIYGVVALAVTRRTREMAIRIAIGAEQSRVMRSIVRDGLKLAVIGLGLGLIVVLPAARLLRSVLVGVSPMDPLAVSGGIALLLSVAVVASVLPARRVTRIDPMTTLREE